MAFDSRQATRRRHHRIRKNLAGTPDRPRLAVFRSHNHIYVQVIDDVNQRTLAAASTLDPSLKQLLDATATCTASEKVGELIAQRAIAQGIQRVVFDRGGNLYHGRVKALADAARAGGLEF